MSRNQNFNFAENPVNLDIQRSKFHMPFDHKTTLNAGDLVPIGLWEYLPGDTASINLTSLVRMTTPIYPVMDNAYMDIYFFSVPNRLVWEHWKEFMGENSTTYWTQPIEYTIPQITAPTGGWKKGTIADYLGLPINVDNISVDAMPFRVYSLIYNEWFRSENLIEPLDINKGDATLQGSNGTDPTVDCQLGGYPAKVGRLADYFSSALPAPQKGPDVYIPLGSQAPVVFGNQSLGNITATSSGINQNAVGKNAFALNYNSNNYVKGAGGLIGFEHDSALAQGQGTVQQDLYGNNYNLDLPNDAARLGIYSNNLIVDLGQAIGATVNQLRQSFAIQRMYEKDARSGTRYTEIIRGHFSVISPDARQQRPEYLGGTRVPVNMTQVIQQSGTTQDSPIGTTSAFSLTIDTNDMFTKSFTEHGYIMALACIRTDRTYQQGIERMWSRKIREDFYFPSLANIGEQYIKNKEIYAQGNSEDEEAFGYQEAWAEYRYKPNRISGELRSTYELPLDSWHYGDKYDSLPILGRSWFEETKNNVQRTLAIETQDQFIADFYFKSTWVRPMPIYSIPGLIDHH